MNLKKIFRHGALLLPLAGIIAYGTFVEPARIELTRHAMGSASAQAGIRIVQVSDLHLRKMDGIRQTVAQRVVEAGPDVVVLSGDIVDHPDSLPALDAFLGKLGPVTKIAVPGNWEYWSEVDLKALGELYARHQAKLLVNDCQIVRKGNRTLAFVGLDDSLAGSPNLAKAQMRCGDADGRVLIEHAPGFLGEPLDAPVESAPYLLILSGHTHGGQITFFGRPFETPPGSGAYNRGWYETKLGKLYVSRGIGATVLPMRIGAVPELPVFQVNQP